MAYISLWPIVDSHDMPTGHYFHRIMIHHLRLYLLMAISLLNEQSKEAIFKYFRIVSDRKCFGKAKLSLTIAQTYEAHGDFKAKYSKVKSKAGRGDGHQAHHYYTNFYDCSDIEVPKWLVCTKAFEEFLEEWHAFPQGMWYVYLPNGNCWFFVGCDSPPDWLFPGSLPTFKTHSLETLSEWSDHWAEMHRQAQSSAADTQSAAAAPSDDSSSAAFQDEIRATMDEAMVIDDDSAELSPERVRELLCCSFVDHKEAEAPDDQSSDDDDNDDDDDTDAVDLGCGDSAALADEEITAEFGDEGPMHQPTEQPDVLMTTTTPLSDEPADVLLWRYYLVLKRVKQASLSRTIGDKQHRQLHAHLHVTEVAHLKRLAEVLKAKSVDPSDPAHASLYNEAELPAEFTAKPAGSSALPPEPAASQLPVQMTRGRRRDPFLAPSRMLTHEDSLQPSRGRAAAQLACAVAEASKGGTSDVMN